MPGASKRACGTHLKQVENGSDRGFSHRRLWAIVTLAQATKVNAKIPKFMAMAPELSDSEAS